MKTYKFKLYRSKRNKYLDKLLSTACDIYNFSLSYKKNLYTNDKININKNDLQKVLTQLKDTDGYQYWNDLGSQVIQDITDRIYKGYNLFFLNLKNKGSRKVSPPKFKKKRKYKSITFKQAGYKLLPGNSIKIGKKIFKYHKSREVLGGIKTLTIKKNPLGEYFIYITTDYKETIQFSTLSGNMIGFDFGLKNFLTGSDGYVIESPLFFNKEKNRISKLSKKVSKKKKGSNNRKRALLNLARAHEDIKNKREDFHWKLSNELVFLYDYIFLENLNLHEMKVRFGKKISDLGFGDFVKKLEYLCLKYSKNLVKINRWYPSSKRCNNCGYINEELKLKDRNWQCKECKAFHDRDINAAKNILEEGKKFIVRALTIKIDTVIPSGN